MTFEELGLGRSALDGVQALGYEEPTPIQEQSIPYALEGRDILACAQTGTGKTAAFVLPILDRIPVRGSVSALIITPTRELCVQIEEVAKTVSGETGHKVVAIYGGVGYEPQIKKLRTGVDLVVATPGRLLDLQRRGDLDLHEVSVLVLDEADRMLDMGFWPDVRKIIALVPKKRQNLLFSATLDSRVQRVIGDTLTDPVKVDVAPAATPVENITQYVYPVGSSQKTELLVAMLQEWGEYRAIIFTRTKQRADRVEQALLQSGVECIAIHSDRSQSQRTAALKNFKNGKHSLLVATDVVARGIDVDGVTHVVNYDMPDRPDEYVHRIGRTARAGATGIAVTLTAYEDLTALYDIERNMGMTIESRDVEGFEYKDRILPRAERKATGTGQSVFSGGVMRRRGATRRWR